MLVLKRRFFPKDIAWLYFCFPHCKNSGLTKRPISAQSRPKKVAWSKREIPKNTFWVWTHATGQGSKCMFPWGLKMDAPLLERIRKIHRVPSFEKCKRTKRWTLVIWRHRGPGLFWALHARPARMPFYYVPDCYHLSAPRSLEWFFHAYGKCNNPQVPVSIPSSDETVLWGLIYFCDRS